MVPLFFLWHKGIKKFYIPTFCQYNLESFNFASAFPYTMQYFIHQFANGIRLIHYPVSSPVAHCAILVNTGSRDEWPEEHGLAHFVEHTIFKGTTHRKPWHIISALEDVGGDLNAYTTKEETCVHASFMKEDFAKAFDLLSDLIFRATFPEKEIEKEKEIVLDEINSYLDTPSELILDSFEELIYSDNPLGRSILGRTETVRQFTRSQILAFIERTYHTDQMVVAAAGEIDSKKLVRLAEKYFGSLPARIRTDEAKKYRQPPVYHSIQRTENRNTYQTHCVIGTTAYHLNDKRRIGLHLLNNILGGPHMSSRLNMSLRERYGYTYTVEANYTPYSDAGLLTIYFGTDKNYLDKSIRLIRRETEKLRTTKLGSLQLHRAKKQLIGQIAIASENNEAHMLSIGKSLLVFDRVDTIKEVTRKIEEVTDSALLEIANEILHHDKLSMLIYQ